MRQRLSPDARRADILAKARKLMLARGYGATEMEDIRRACDISRGGLYHHFDNKRAILEGLVLQETEALAKVLSEEDTPPIQALLGAGSTHLGQDPGILSAVETREERLLYLSALHEAFWSVLLPPLRARLVGQTRDGTDPEHLAELFLATNAHINQREILGDWTQAEAAGFAATALTAMAGLLADPAHLAPLIRDLTQAGARA